MDISRNDKLERNYSIEGNINTDGQAGLISPQGSWKNCSTANPQVCRKSADTPPPFFAGGDALPKLVNRTVEVSEEQWLALHKNTDSTAVPDKSQKPGKVPKVIRSSTRSAQHTDSDVAQCLM